MRNQHLGISSQLCTTGNNILVENKERVKLQLKPLTKAEWTQLKSKQEEVNTNGTKQ